MNFKLKTITSLLLFLLTGPVLAQSITVTPSPVSAAKGATASVTLAFVADDDTTNFDFTMDYDPAVVDESAIVADCTAATGLGLTVMSCVVNTTANQVRGIGTNIPPSVLTGGNFATIDFPVLPGAANGDSVQALNASFSASGVGSPFDTTWTLTVLKADQTIWGFAANPATGTIGGNSTLSATASSGLTVTFASSTPSFCSVAGSTVSFLATGTCTVSADQAGDADYNPAPQESLGITVNKADQVIADFAANPASGAVAGSSTLSAIASSALTVVFGSSTLAVCSVSGNTATYLTTGTCTVTANQTGNDTYNPAPQGTLDISVAPDLIFCDSMGDDPPCEAAQP